MQSEHIYYFNEAKNKKLKRERGISFEDVIKILQEEKELDVLKHPNQVKYPDQIIYVVEFNGYAYVIPALKEGRKIFLMTIFANRKYTKRYLKK